MAERVAGTRARGRLLWTALLCGVVQLTGLTQDPRETGWETVSENTRKD